jgi:hypothetical protein
MEIARGCLRNKRNLVTMESRLIKFLFIIVLVSTPFSIAQAQEESQLLLRLSRNFGYSSGTGDIQGTFTMKVDGPQALTRVVFYVDDQVIGEANEPPFQLRFRTGDFPLGVHTLSAVGYTSQGVELNSNLQRRNFVPAEVGMQVAGKIILPLLGIILLTVLISIAAPTIVGRGRKSQLPLGAQRNYGLFGGTICPKCKRSFGMHAWGLNLAVGKFDRCPHCGKWSLVRRVPQTLLQEAEAAELLAADNPSPVIDSIEDRLRRDIDESRFQDLD